MPRLHTMHAASRPARSRAKTHQSTEFIKHEITSADAPKIAIGTAVVIALLSFGLLKVNSNNAQYEKERMTRQMKLESGALSGELDSNLSPAQADEAQQELQDNDPNFKA